MAGSSAGHFDAIVIGSGFGGAVAITELVKKKLRDNSEPKILVLERGTWWRNPEGPALRRYKTAKAEILDQWQYWPRPNDSQGLVYIRDSIYKEHSPLGDLLNPFLKDNDLGVKKNRKGMYRLSRFSDDNGNVDVVSGSAVGGGSLFYSGVNLIPHGPVLQRIGLGHLTSEDFRNAGKWMHEFRGKINKLNTKVPVPHYVPETGAVDPTKHYQLSRIPESPDPAQSIDYEMPNPELDGKPDEDYLLLDRARVLKRAMQRVIDAGGFSDGASQGEVWQEEGGKQFGPLPLSVVEYDPKPDSSNPGNESDSTKNNAFCAREGRCTLGCLPSARHTLYKTLQKQKEKGRDITVLPLTKVSHIDWKGEDYVVRFESELDGDEGDFEEASAKMVFLGGGCLGTTEIMLRTREKFEDSNGEEGLPLSPMVGKNFSTNGDFFAFSYNLPRDYKARRKVKNDDRLGNVNPTVGPINSSHFYVIFDKDSPKRVDVNVEDAGIPTMFARLVHAVLPHFKDWETFLSVGKAAVRLLMDRDPFPTDDDPDTNAREQAAYLTERELVSNVFFYNLMGAGPGEPLGTFSLQSDGSGMDLSYDKNKKLHDWSVFRKHEKVLGQLTKKMTDAGEDAKRLPGLMTSPFWKKDKRVTVVHPLGGCPIGPTSREGAIDKLGRVFDGSKPEGSTDVLEGLYVVDAAAIPGALGVNPTYTIVTHAVKCMNKVAF